MPRLKLYHLFSTEITICSHCHITVLKEILFDASITLIDLTVYHTVLDFTSRTAISGNCNLPNSGKAFNYHDKASSQTASVSQHFIALW